MATPVADLYVRVRATFDELKKVGSQVEAALAPARQSLRRVGTALSASVTLPLLAVGKQALDTAARFDTLERGLTAIVGSSEEAAKQIKRLKEIAKAPGINFEQALAGSRNLQVVGFSAEFAEEAVKQLGNAVALTGGTADDLTEITRQLTQIKELGKITAENFNVVAERAPVMRTALENAFGTTSIEELRKRGINVDQFIQGIVKGLQGIPRATGGIANDLQNLRSDIQAVFLEIGKVIIPVATQITSVLSPALQKLAAFIERIPGPVKVVALAFAGLLAVLGPLALGISALLTPVGGVVAGLALLGAAGFALVKDWDNIKLALIAVFEAIKFEFLSTIQEMVRGLALFADIPFFDKAFPKANAEIKLLKQGVDFLALNSLQDLQSALKASDEKASVFTDTLKELKEKATDFVVPSLDLSGSSGGGAGSGPALPERQAIPNFQAIDPAPIEQVTTSIDGMNLKLREAPIIAQEVNETFGAVGAIASLAFEGISSGIDNAIDRLFFVNGKFLELKNIAATLGDVFKNVFQNLIKDLVAATVKALALKAILAAFGISAPTGGFGGIFSTVLGGGGLGNFLGGGGAPIGGGALPANRLSVQQSVTPYGVVQKINETAAVRSTRFYGG